MDSFPLFEDFARLSTDALVHEGFFVEADVVEQRRVRVPCLASQLSLHDGQVGA